MTQQLNLRAYGRTVALIGTPASVAEALACLPPTYVPAEAASPETTLNVDEAEPPRVASELEVWVAEHARGFIFVHAGCVALNGRAILLPGRSRSGKSTLTAALVRAGAEYLSDEYAVIDPDGLVYPYPRPLSIRNTPLGASSERVSAATLGATATEPARAAVVATLRYQADIPGLMVDHLTRGQTMIDLLANTVPASVRPRESFAAAEAVTDGVTGLRGVRGDAAAAAADLLARLVDG